MGKVRNARHRSAYSRPELKGAVENDKVFRLYRYGRKNEHQFLVGEHHGKPQQNAEYRT